MDRKIDAVWHYDERQYRTADGMEVVPTEFEWELPCKVCRGPAEVFLLDDTHEHYRCLNCGHEFKVNC